LAEDSTLVMSFIAGCQRQVTAALAGKVEGALSVLARSVQGPVASSTSKSQLQPRQHDASISDDDSVVSEDSVVDYDNDGDDTNDGEPIGKPALELFSQQY